MKLQTFLTFVGLLSPALAQKILPGAYIAEIKGTVSYLYVTLDKSYN